MLHQVRLQLLDGHPIDARRAFIRHHPLVGRHHVLAADNRCHQPISAPGWESNGFAVVFDAPKSCACDCRPLPSDRAPNFSVRSPASPLTIERPASVRRFMFSPSPAWWCRLLRLLLSSAAPSRRLTTPVAHPLPGAGRQTSQGKTRDLRAIYPSHIRPHPPGDIGLRVFWPPRPDADASCASCSSGRHFAYSFLQTPPRDDALAVRLTVPITRARRGLSPPSHRSDTNPTKSRQSRRSAPCLAHQAEPTGRYRPVGDA
jgi:hypothetical protein